jgi:hypothetical protein
MKQNGDAPPPTNAEILSDIQLLTRIYSSTTIYNVEPASNDQTWRLFFQRFL